MEVPNSRSILLFLPLGVFTTTCGGMVGASACSRSDCSGDRNQSLPNRSLQYREQNSQKLAYQGVVSCCCAWGPVDMTQPLSGSISFAASNKGSPQRRVKLFKAIGLPFLVGNTSPRVEAGQNFFHA